MVQQVQQFVGRFRGITPQRVRNSLSVRMMRAIGRLRIVRTIASYGYSGRGGVSSKLFPGIDPALVTTQIQRDGICLGLKLPPMILEAILEFAHSTPCYGNRDPKLGYLPKDRLRAESTTGTPFTVGGYFNTHQTCAAIRELTADPVLREIALRYVGPRAKHLGTNMWWSYANDRPRADRNNFAQLFHYDLDDYKFIKFFFYLTDVDPTSGPHVYVRGTHTNKLLRHTYPMRRLEDEEVSRAYASDDVLVLEGKAGDGFVEDTFGLHKGLPPQRADRLILQFEFALARGYTDDRCDSSNLKSLPLS